MKVVVFFFTYDLFGLCQRLPTSWTGLWTQDSSQDVPPCSSPAPLLSSYFYGILCCGEADKRSLFGAIDTNLRVIQII